jgi:hypothetical protein
MTGYELISLCIKFDFGCTKAAAKAVLVALASFYNEERNGSWPGQKDLISRSACERKTVMSSVQWLEERQIIFVDRVVGNGNFYRFNFDLLMCGLASPENGTSGKNGTSPKNVTSPENGTGVVPKTALDQSRKRDCTSPENGTQINKKKEIKEKEKTSDVSFSSKTDSELLTLMDDLSWEDAFEARAEYARRVAERTKHNLRPDFEQPDRPQYEILGMHH